MNPTAQEFLRRAAEKAGDSGHRRIIDRNMATYHTNIASGKKRFANWEAARSRASEIKWDAINHLDRYLLEFEQRVTERGGHVFWAANAEEARRYIADLATARGVHRVVKSKSMVTEEIHLTPALEKRGIEVFETDLGEYIVQLRNEPPYHIVTPAMHLSRVEIAKLFREKLEGVTSDDPPGLVAAARRALRKAFFSAEMGISGANFLVADAGMIALTTNEGNGRLGTTLPRIHVAITGIEKIVPRLADLALMWPVLTTIATGQHLSAYKTLIGGPRQPGEVDGPDEFHVVLLDNGRTDVLADPEQREVLHCIRCGACLNVCPVYCKIGGHAYGTTYQGPIGSVLTPHLRGIKEFQHLPNASSLCGACSAICPVRINLHHHLLQSRRNAVQQTERPFIEKAGFRFWRWTMSSAGRFRVLGKFSRTVLRFVRDFKLTGTAADPMHKWNKYRVAPDVPRESFRELWRKRNGAR
jgi:L-lactate dehydrogenase complex protein LldF